VNTWKVTTPEGDVEVSAISATTTACGDLVFAENNGVLNRAFASGTWTRCELMQRAQQGYR